MNMAARINLRVVMCHHDVTNPIFEKYTATELMYLIESKAANEDRPMPISIIPNSHTLSLTESVKLANTALPMAIPSRNVTSIVVKA